MFKNLFVALMAATLVLMAGCNAGGSGNGTPPSKPFVDADLDGIPDNNYYSGGVCRNGNTVACNDNCVGEKNPAQTDADDDGIGDGDLERKGKACDDFIDSDHDGFAEAKFDHACGETNNGGSLGEADPNVCNDNCPNTPNGFDENGVLLPNAQANNNDGDAFGDVCDADWDNDTVLNADDNCPTEPNNDQADANNNGIGNACESQYHCAGFGFDLQVIANVTDHADARQNMMATATAMCDGVLPPACVPGDIVMNEGNTIDTDALNSATISLSSLPIIPDASGSISISGFGDVEAPASGDVGKVGFVIDNAEDFFTSAFADNVVVTTKWRGEEQQNSSTLSVLQAGFFGTAPEPGDSSLVLLTIAPITNHFDEVVITFTGDNLANPQDPPPERLVYGACYSKTSPPPADSSADLASFIDQCYAQAGVQGAAFCQALETAINALPAQEGGGDADPTAYFVTACESLAVGPFAAYKDQCSNFAPPQ